jgi:excisionase family DNA binding protein
LAPVQGGQFEPTVLLMPGATHPAAVTQPNLSLAEPLLKPSEAADLLSVRTSWIYEAVRAGTLPCLKIGRHICFTRSMLEDWLATRTIGHRGTRTSA